MLGGRTFGIGTKDASFLQVIQHIEAALKQNTGVSDNKYTVPPLRDNETQDPSLKGVLGTEKTKLIPGNWAAPMGTDPNKVEPGDPLTKDKAGNQSKNRNVFSRSFRVGWHELQQLYSLRAVGKSHNSTAPGSHGKALGSFYSRNRVLPDDKFQVWIVN